MVAGVTAYPWTADLPQGTDETFTIEDPASYVVTFKDDGTVEIVADCNSAFGTYTLDGIDATIEIGPATLAACPGEFPQRAVPATAGRRHPIAFHRGRTVRHP